MMMMLRVAYYGSMLFLMEGFQMMHQGERETMGDDEWRDEDVNSLAWNNADKAGRLW